MSAEMRANSVVALSLASAMFGCVTAPDPYPVGSMLPGKLISLADGKVIQTQIQISPASHPTGTMTAVDPKSGQSFEGTYTCVMGSKVVEHQVDDGWGGSETMQSVETDVVAPCTAVLVGNKGTVLNIQMNVRAGNPPVGTGTAEDNGGKKYTIMF